MVYRCEKWSVPMRKEYRPILRAAENNKSRRKVFYFLEKGN
jgi:hypothetical protein